jgi:hypothetical protein
LQRNAKKPPSNICAVSRALGSLGKYGIITRQMMLRITVLIIVLSIISGCSVLGKKPKKKAACHFEPTEELILESCNNEAFGINLWKKHSQVVNQNIALLFEGVMSKLDAPKEDGEKYSGKIAICLDRNGKVDQLVLTQSSGHLGLDEAFMAAIKETEAIDISQDPCIADILYYTQYKLEFNELDMQN